MGQNKKQVRAAFRNVVFTRDRFTCRLCGYKSSIEKSEDDRL
jgi:transcription elongation factor Elf1